MVSLQSPNQRTSMILEAENSIPAQKRKALEGSQTLASDHQKRPKDEFQNFMADIELHLETPLPSEWQRCLDIQSGKIHFYNTKTHARTSTDPRKTTNTTLEGGDDQNITSLDLELNLTSSSRGGGGRTSSGLISVERNKSASPPAPWLAAEVERRQEMVATVCMRCHMLVMLCRSSPACPNCKFVHSPDKPPSTFFVQVKF